MDTAILIHKKHLTTLQSALATYDQKGAKMNIKNPQKQNEVKGLSLEQGLLPLYAFLYFAFFCIN